MTFRPIAARWFELLTVGADVPVALDALARTGAVELEVAATTGGRFILPDIDDLSKAFHELARTHGAHWPEPEPPLRRADHPRRLLESAWRRIVAWRADADPVIAEIERLTVEIADLARLETALRHAPADAPDLAHLAGAGPRLAARLWSFPSGGGPRRPWPGLLSQHWDGEGEWYLLLLGAPEDIRDVEVQLPAMKGQPVPLPTWLPAEPSTALDEIAARSRRLTEAEAAAGETLAALAGRHDLATALGDFALIEWLGRHSRDIVASDRLAWVTGWTADETGDGLRRALAARGVRFLLRTAPAPTGSEPPSMLDNPRWAKMFETIVAMLGTPGRLDADPSVALALIAPVMFGFMFGDVGQGLVLIAVGLWAGPRLPTLRLLVPGGVAAVVFGFLFGSVFCREDLIPPLWIHPLSAAPTLLAVALAWGIALLTFGLMLDAFQAFWRNDLNHWIVHRGGLVLAYAGALATVVWRPAIWITALGALWFVLGPAATAREARGKAAGIAAAEFLEQMSQLLVNTISFARVGAFALAHAGLSAAIVGVASIFGGVGYGLALVLGNLLVLALEGLVVGIQTTRLVLFEFFIRFLRGGGRAFRPLEPPRFDWAAEPRSPETREVPS